MTTDSDSPQARSEKKSLPLVGWILIIAALIVLIFFTIKTVITRAYAAVEIKVYAYSTMEEAMQRGIFPAFEAQWAAENGSELTIQGIFGPSETIAGQINLGAPADVVILSNLHHLNWLKVGKLIDPDHQGKILVQTPMVIVTRPGNPAGITSFGDLSQPGINLLHPDPSSSGAGQWAVLAEYGSNLIQSQDPNAAKNQLVSIWQNVNLMGSSARATLTLFEMGAGDVLVTYEQDARLALERGVPMEIILPDMTIIAQPIVVGVDRNIKRYEENAVNGFINFLFSDAGQEILAGYEFRPPNYQGERFPPLQGTFKVSELGGWPAAYNTILESIWKAEIDPELDLRAPLRLENGGED